MITDKDINQVFKSAADSREALYNVAELYELAKLNLEKGEALALFEGVEGKNKEQREAALRVQLHEEYETLGINEAVYRQAKFNHDRNVFELGRVKALLRLMETEAILAQITTA